MLEQREVDAYQSLKKMFPWLEREERSCSSFFLYDLLGTDSKIGINREFRAFKWVKKRFKGIKLYLPTMYEDMTLGIDMKGLWKGNKITFQIGGPAPRDFLTNYYLAVDKRIYVYKNNSGIVYV